MSLNHVVLAVILAAQLAWAGSPRVAEQERVLTGTLSIYHFVNPVDGGILPSTVLLLSQPTDVSSRDRHGLEDALIVELNASDDSFLLQFGQLLGQRVTVRCTLTTATLWGFRHATCVPTSIAPAI